MKIKLKSKKWTIIVFSLVFIAILICFWYYFYSRSSTQSTLVAIEASNSEKAHLLSTLEESLNNMKNNSYSVNIYNGEDSYVTACYNDNGESIMQASDTGDTSIYRNDKVSIRFSDYIQMGQDSEVFGIMNNVFNLCKEGKAYIYKNNNLKSDSFTTMLIDVKGWDNIEEMYKYVSDDFASLMIEQLKSYVGADNQLNFRFAIAISNDNMLASVMCYTYTGNTNSTDVLESDLNGNWGYDGYLLLDDWQLSDGWYSDEWENLENWKDTSFADELYLKDVENVVNILNSAQG